jgi:hypothetical protein
MWRLLCGLSQEVAVKLSDTKKVNPKRLARQAAYELSKNGVSTHAQKAMNLEYEKNKREKQTCSNSNGKP